MDYEVSSGVTESGIILENDTMTVLDGGIATDTTVKGGGKLQVSSGGTADNTILYEGRMDVFFGGVANSLTAEGGSGKDPQVYISSGGTAINLFCNSKSQLTIGNGAVIHGITFNPGISIRVSSQTTMTEIIENGGYVEVQDGAIVSFVSNSFSGLVLGGNGKYRHESATVHSGTTAVSTTILSGTMFVYEGGMATATIVSSRGSLSISSGGTIVDTTVNSGGSLSISSGGTAKKALVNNDGNFFITSGGTAENLVLSDNKGKIDIQRGAVIHGITLNSGISIGIAGDTFIAGIVENGGYVRVQGSAITASTFIANTFSGQVFSKGSATLHSGTTAFDTTITSGARIEIYESGKAIETTIYGGGLTIYSGGTADSTTINSGGSMTIYSGMINSTTINSGGKLTIYSGMINSTTINSGGRVEFYGKSDMVANNTIVNSGGSLSVNYGGIANDIVENGGYVSVSNRSDATFASNTFSGIILSNAAATVHSGTTAVKTLIDSSGRLYVYDGGIANDTTLNIGGELIISSGGTATNIIASSGTWLRLTVASDTYIQGTSNGSAFEMKDAFLSGYAVKFGRIEVCSDGTAENTLVNGDGELYVSSGGTATDIIWTPCVGHVFVDDGGMATFASLYSGVYYGSDNQLLSHEAVMDSKSLDGDCEMNVMSGGITTETTVNSGGYLYVSGGGVTNSTTVNSDGWLYVSNGGTANSTMVNGGGLFVSFGGKIDHTSISNGMVRLSSGTASNTEITQGVIYVGKGGIANNTIVRSGGRLYVSSGGTANSTTVNGGWLYVSSSGKLTGKMFFESGASVFASEGAILDFDLTQVEAGEAALVNDLSIIKGTPVYTLTVDADSWKPGSYVYALADGAENFASTISVVDKMSGDELGVLTVGETANINGTEYLLTNKDSELFVTVKCGDTPSKPKWTYLVYMAADSDISYCALYDIVSMQQANIDSEIEVYVLADRSTVDNPRNGDYVTAYGTYKWDSLWPDTRVGKITCSPGLTVTVDWESWGELDTGSIATLKRFIDWGQEQSPAENYGLIVWDHGRENTTLCFDRTTNPDGEACFTVSELSDLLKEKGNIPLVILNNCMLGSELVVTQMAGNTDVIVVSEPLSYGMSTYNYNAFFNTITADMTAQEMAAIMVQNVESPGIGGVVTMLTAVDVTVSRLAGPLEALAEAIAAADNAADKTVLINALLKAPLDGCLYDGKKFQQSDLGFLIRDVMEDPGYESTSGGFKKALADVKAALDAIVLEYRSVPSGRGSGLTVCNTVCSAENFVGSGDSVEKADAEVKSYIISTYKSNPLWGGLLYDLCSTYLAESADKISPPATFNVSYVDGLVPGGTVAVSDLGCFPGSGEMFDGIHVIGEAFFGFVNTAEDKAAGGFTVANDIGAEVTVSLLAADGTVIGDGENGVSFENLAAGTYYLRLQSGTNCHVTLSTTAEFVTGTDRFDYAGSGQNEAHVNGNGSIDQATLLDEGYYSGLITCKGDTDYYRIGDIHTKKCRIQVKGQDGWTVAEYDADGVLVQSAVFSDGQYNLTMDSLNYLLVEGASALEDAIEPYTLNVIGIDNDSSDAVVLDDLTGTKDEVSWKPSAVAPKYTVQFSTDSFEHAYAFETAGTAVDLLGIPAGTYRWRVMADTGSDDPWYDGEEFVSDNTNDKPRVFQSKADASDDVFFASPNGTWSSRYSAKHVGSVADWSGTGEMVSAAGKGRIQDLFLGSVDPGTLCLTDSENGDALFLDDVYTVLPDEIEENTARLFRLQEIFAGAGDDIVDMTSQQFEYTGSKLFIYGGDGDDVIWASKGRNMLFGDDGNDRIVGASGDDVLVGGIGDDAMHGGGGSDIFTFCENWGVDTIEQIADGSVTLWFLTGDESNWNPEALTYTDGENSVTVSGVSAENVTLKFGIEESEVFVRLYYKEAFAEFASQKIFEPSGFLASV